MHPTAALAWNALGREKRGLAYVYTLTRSREEYAAQAVRQIIAEVLDGDARGLARALRDLRASEARPATPPAEASLHSPGGIPIGAVSSPAS